MEKANVLVTGGAGFIGSHLVGYEHRVSLERGIPELLSWVRAQAAQDQVASATA